jgi:hypothetical protein
MGEEFAGESSHRFGITAVTFHLRISIFQVRRIGAGFERPAPIILPISKKEHEQ